MLWTAVVVAERLSRDARWRSQCDNSFLPDGLPWSDAERQGEALRLAVSAVWGGARAAISTQDSDVIHAAKRQTAKNIVPE